MNGKQRNDDVDAPLRFSKLCHPSLSESSSSWNQVQYDEIRQKLYASNNVSKSNEMWPSDRDDGNLFDADVKRKRKRIRRLVLVPSSSRSSDSSDVEDSVICLGNSVPKVPASRLRPLGQIAWENRILWGEEEENEEEEEAEERRRRVKRKRDKLLLAPQTMVNTNNKNEEKDEDSFDLFDLLERQQTDETPSMFEQEQQQQLQQTTTTTTTTTTDRNSLHWGDVQTFEKFRAERANSNDSNYGDVVEDDAALDTKRRHPEELQLNRSFASYDWLNGVLWDNESIPTNLERKLRALVVDENDTSIILDKFVSEPRTRSSVRIDEDENAWTNQDSNNNSRRSQSGSRVARIVLEGNAWPADKLIDEAYSAEMDNKQLARFHRPVWEFAKDERSRKFEIKYMSKRKGKSSKRRRKIPKLQSVGNTNSAMRTSSDLSLRSGEFIMIEHMERFPMCLPNFGMVSRLVHFHQLDKNKITGNHKQDLSRAEKLFRENQKKIIGDDMKPEGKFRVLQPKERIPIMGGVEVESGSTVSVFASRLFHAPVVKHTPNSNDFLLVRSKPANSTTRGAWSYHIREISSLYVVGQHTPKHMVFTPNRRPFKKFQADYVLFWLDKMFRYARTMADGQKGVELREIEQLFPSVSSSLLRGQMKRIASARKKTGGRFWERKKDLGSLNNDHADVKPYKVCLYEAMQAGIYRLKKKYLQKLHKLDQGNRTVFGYLEKLQNVMKEQQALLPKMGDISVDEERALIVKQKFERAKMRVEKATYCYRQILISPWVTSRNFIKSLNSKETLQIVDRAPPPCKSLDPLGGQGDGVAFHIPGQNARGKKSRDRTSSYDDGSVYTEHDIREWSATRRREELLKLGVSSRQIDGMATWEQKRKLKVYHLGQGRVKGRRAKYRDRVQRIFKAQVRMLAETGGEDSDLSSSSDDEILPEALEKLEKNMEANMERRRGNIEGKNKSSKASEEKAAMDLMQSLRQKKNKTTTTTSKAGAGDDDVALAQVRDILSKSLSAQNNRAFVPPPPIITTSNAMVMKPLSRNSSSSSLLGSRSISTLILNRARTSLSLSLSLSLTHTSYIHTYIHTYIYTRSSGSTHTHHIRYSTISR